MAGVEGDRGALHDLRTSADRLIHRILPWRGHESRDAIEHFLDRAGTSSVCWQDLEATLVDFVTSLDRHIGGGPPCFVDRLFLDRRPWHGHNRAALLDQFASCLEAVATHRGAKDPMVRAAIALIDASYRSPDLTATWLAKRLGRRLTSLCDAVRRHTGMTCSELIRNVRLERAAHCLVSSDRTIKETWATVGYNHNANFHHDFRKRFGVTPTEYRRRWPRPTPSDSMDRNNTPPTTRGTSEKSGRLLVVDDDEDTLRTNGYYLEQQGFDVVLALTGEEGLSMAKERRADAVLSDYHLGDMDGVTFCRRLRQQGAMPRTAILTADWLVDQDQIRMVGAVVVLKPCWLEDLLTVVLNLTRSTSFPSSA